jgi:hypothetical protein
MGIIKKKSIQGCPAQEKPQEPAWAKSKEKEK